MFNPFQNLVHHSMIETIIGRHFQGLHVTALQRAACLPSPPLLLSQQHLPFLCCKNAPLFDTPIWSSGPQTSQSVVLNILDFQNHFQPNLAFSKHHHVHSIPPIFSCSDFRLCLRNLFTSLNLWYLRHLRTSNNDNHSDMAIESDTGHWTAVLDKLARLTIIWIRVTIHE